MEAFWYEVSAVSYSPALIKDISSLHNPRVLCRRIIAQKVVKILSIRSVQALMKNQGLYTKRSDETI